MADNDPAMQDLGRVKQQLEHRYIELLEKRIATLEALNEGSETEASEDPTSVRCESEKVAPTEEDHHKADGKVSDHDEGASSMTRLRERVLILDSVPEENDISTTEFEALVQQPTLEKEGNSRKESHKLTWYRVLSEKRKYRHSEFSVESQELQALLRIVLAHYPRLHFPSDGILDSMTFSSPFKELIHNWDKLEAITNDESTEYNLLRGSVETFGPRTDDHVNHLASAMVRLAQDGSLEQARHQLREMLLRIRSTPELRSFFSGVDGQEKRRSVQFDYLWTIFPPGEIVISSVFMREPQLFIAKEGYESHESSESGREKKRVWKLICWAYDWNGKTFNRVPVKFIFEEFQGSRGIDTLDAYPLKFRSNTPTRSTVQLKELLCRRGERFRELCIRAKGKQMLQYEGDAIARGTGFSKLGNRDERDHHVFRYLGHRRKDRTPQAPAKSQRIDGRVMVDFVAYLQHGPGTSARGPMGDAILSGKDYECRCSICSNNEALRKNQKTYWDDVTPESEFESLQLELCPPRVLGYHLENKTWVELNISLDEDEASEKPEGRCLKDIKQLMSKEAFGKLQLVKSQKDLVRDLVKSHASGTTAKPLLEDIIRGKGKGLVILLHGPPGVGKTLTAESVAQLTGKPLFSVGVADIGLDPQDVEENLQALFELAANWKAVLLFDEADVFLESRSSHTSDLGRNALVSVLLRVLEYYDGILILTTNRIREFDVAVQSRVNLGIKYDDLDREQKVRIIDNFLKQLKDENVEKRDEIHEWFDEHEDGREQIKFLNGRQVRNILFSAASLATQDGMRLNLGHIQKMTKATFLFHDSIKTIVDEARRRAEARRD